MRDYWGEDIEDPQPKKVPTFLAHQLHTIEPWMDEPENIPIRFLKTETELSKTKLIKMKKMNSLEVIPRRNILSPRKQFNRPSQQIPKMNIGHQPLCKSQSKPKQISPKRRKSQPKLPAVNVSRVLAVQRKLFLIGHKEQNSSPIRKTINRVIKTSKQSI